VRIEYELEPEDWGVFAQHCAARSRPFQRTMQMSRIVGSLGLIFATLSFLGGPVAQRALLAALLASAWCWLTPRLMYRSVRRGALECERPCNRGRHALESSPDGLHAKCDVTESVHAWTGVRSVTSAPAHVFVLIGDALGYVIPRRRVISGVGFPRLSGHYLKGG